MRKVFFAIITCCVMISACNKNSSTSGPGGWWTFQSSTYAANSCSATVGGVLTASNLNSNNIGNYGTFECNFYQALPSTGGSFTVVNYPPLAADQISLSVTVMAGNIGYASSGGHNGNEKVNVTIVNGKVNISGMSIMMLNSSGGSDSSALSLGIIQTQ